MGLSASQGRMLLLTARQSDLEYRAQNISQKRLNITQKLEEVSMDYENATSNRQMKISLFLSGEGSDGENVQRTSNLTYAALVSGTLAQFDSSQSGIVSYSRTADQQYASNSAYRLVDCDGAIVVSDKSEIPSTLAVTTSNESTEAKYNDKTITNLYQTGSKTINDDGSETFSKSKYYAFAQEGTPLAEALDKNKDGNDECNVKIDMENGLISVTDTETGETKYYILESGLEADEEMQGKFQGTQEATLVGTKDKIPKTETTSMNGDNVTLEGSDGKYSLTQNGVVVQRYVVDETLKYGSTDASGNTDGPNYLQDCLRNGKYLIEKAQKSSDDGEIKWRGQSWDTLSNVQDSYYTDDDDRAKAKYDRLQNQLQAQDKKLELELNNIEAQRSAVSTEKESVEKVINENIEGSFNTFA